MEALSVLKQKIVELALATIQQRIVSLEQQLRLIGESRESETKSSMGDKYETGAAMLQLEAEKIYEQLQRNRLLKLELEQLELDQGHPEARRGSLVVTSEGWFLISVGLGRLRVDNRSGYCISVAAPMGKALLGCRPGDEVCLNNRVFTVMGIY